jgi:hypothetical protein
LIVACVRRLAIRRLADSALGELRIVIGELADGCGSVIGFAFYMADFRIKLLWLEALDAATLAVEAAASAHVQTPEAARLERRRLAVERAWLETVDWSKVAPPAPVACIDRCRQVVDLSWAKRAA